jgi:hypothetical protein
MIKQYQKFEMDKLKIEANFSEEVKPCKVIKFTIDGKEAYVNKHDLYALLMLWADDEEMLEAVKITEKKVKMLRKAVKVTTKKDVKAGEDVVFVIEYPVDEDIYNKWEENNKEFLTQEDALAKLQ